MTFSVRVELSVGWGVLEVAFDSSRPILVLETFLAEERLIGIV